MTPALVMAAGWHIATHEVLAAAAVGIAASTLDDIAVDLAFLWLLVRRRVVSRPLPLSATLPGRMAVIVPAWDEAAVIGAMLSDLVRRLDYPDYTVFVGVYPNDPATRAAVVAVVDPHIVIVTCARPGPTTKADCLNHLWRALVADEAVTGRPFKAIVLHDAEDVVDAAELRVFDAAIPGLAMVQLPVMPLADPASRWVSGHYLDEFAEAHGKDIVVRGALGAGVPSAGVACAIDRAVLGQLAGAGGAPFDPSSMTEDYEIGMRIAALGYRGALLRCNGANGVVATREHFPATFETAVRQKTRWLLGIALDGWDRLGWSRGWTDRYMLLRDRKAIVAPLIAGLGYAAVVMVALDAAATAMIPLADRFAPLAARGSVLAWLLTGNAVALGWRLGCRAGFTASVHGWREGIRAVPRTLVGNVINAVAAVRAIRRYARIRAGNETPRWDKTAHRFPGMPDPRP